MKTAFGISILVIGMGFSALASAGKYDEINVRKHVDNQSQNKVLEARLRGMLGGGAQGKGPATGDRDCITQIGNQNADQSLIGSSQDVIIVGDVINVCQ